MDPARKTRNSTSMTILRRTTALTGGNMVDARAVA
jgi:hypothetical protein